MVPASSSVVRLLRRVGRFAIAMVATAAFLAGGGTVLLLTSLIGRAMLPLAFLVACGCAVGTFLLFERGGLLPDDPSEPPTTLGLGRDR